MRTTQFLIMSLAVYCSSTMAMLTAAPVDLPQYGFKLDLLDSAPGSGNGTALMTFLPSSEGFAPNINVVIQTYAGSIQDYITLSKGQFDQLKANVLNEKLNGDSEWQVEYKATMQNNDLHFYARAISKNGKIYLVTGTTKESQWNTFGATIRQHVDSFSLE